MSGVARKEISVKVDLIALDGEKFLSKLTEIGNS